MPDLKNPNEKPLERMEEGRSRLAAVFEREKERFIGFVRRQMDGLAGLDPEDVVADVATQLLARADLVHEVESLSAYVYRSLRNRLLDHVRRPSPAVALREDWEDELPARAVQAVADGPDPEEAYRLAQIREHLREAIGRLGPPERAVWIATEIEGRSFRELAEAWEEPIGTLLSRKSRANAKLRELLHEYRNRY